jgi:hypothetical protein
MPNFYLCYLNAKENWFLCLLIAFFGATILTTPIAALILGCLRVQSGVTAVQYEDAQWFVTNVYLVLAVALYFLNVFRDPDLFDWRYRPSLARMHGWRE